MNLSFSLLRVFLALWLVSAEAQSAVQYQPAPAGSRLEIVNHDRVKNVILLIGDGMSVATLSAARYRGAGIQGRLHMDRMPVAGFVQTCSADRLITDSAAASTALASGFKTNNGVIGRTPQQENVVTIMEAAQARGLSAGLVATSAITHATPAGFAAHAYARSDQSEIALWLLKNRIDVLLGGGMAFFSPDKGKRTDKRNLLQEAADAGYEVLTQREQLLQSSSPRLLGLFADDGMTTHDPEPTLAEMTGRALAALNKNSKGFVLMVEGSQIDWANHRNDLDDAIEQTLAFDLAVREALDFAQNNGSTLVVVTADHETGGLALVGGAPDASTLEAAWTTKGHTASTVPLYAYGPGALHFSGFHDNTELPVLMARLLKIENFPRQQGRVAD